MILHRILPYIIIFYRQILLAIAQELFIVDALVHAPNHLLVRLAELLDFGPIEHGCAGYRHQTGPGRSTTYPVSRLVRAILVGWLYGLSLRGLEERLHSDLIVRWFVGCQSGDPLPDHSTLGRFELWLVHNQAELYFATFLAQVEQYFPQERQAIQVGDTYAMLANAADEGLVRRIRHVCLRLTMELRDSFPNKFESHLQGFDWCGLYGAKPEKSDGLIDKPTRAQRLERTVLAALDFRQRVGDLLAPYDKKQYTLLRGWCSYLDKVLADEVQVERTAAGQPVKVSELPQKDKGTFRIISATDPEATLRVHDEAEEDVALGYNVQISASKAGFIHETKAYTGAAADQSGVAPLIEAQKERQEANGETVHLPPKLLYDKAAGTGKTRAAVAAASDGQTQLVARAMPYDQRSQRFSPYDFTLSPDGQCLSCPFGKTSASVYRSKSGDGREFVFHACQCWLNGQSPKHMDGGKEHRSANLSLRCPLWESCRGLHSGPGTKRQVFVSDYREHVLAAEAYSLTDAFQIEMKQRSLVERVIFELTAYNDARHCRRRGLLGADFQAKMSATACNLKLLARKLSRVVPRRSCAALAG
jgi:hypothetical protein